MRSTKLQKLVWSRFDLGQTRQAGGKADVMLRSSVSLTMAAGSSHREDVEQIARMASRPFSILSISKVLDERKSLRGVVYFGETGSQIDKILHNYPGMRWWMEKDGLVIDIAPQHSANRLPEFDRIAGKLVCDATRHGKLSTDTVGKIAAGLDAAGFTLSENLQPAQWKPIADHNRKHAKSAIKTFAAAVSNPKFVRSVRRRLYVARDRHQKAYGSVIS
jgi:hypothetical protein